MRTKLKGMSLVEVLVASVILVIVVVSVMQIFIIDQRIMRNNYVSMLAEEIIRYEFEKMNKIGDPTLFGTIYKDVITEYDGTYHSASGNPAVFTRDGVDFNLELHVKEIPVTGTYISQAKTPVVLQIEAIVTWTGGSFNMITAISDSGV